GDGDGGGREAAVAVADRVGERVGAGGVGRRLVAATGRGQRPERHRAVRSLGDRLDHQRLARVRTAVVIGQDVDGSRGAVFGNRHGVCLGGGFVVDVLHGDVDVGGREAAVAVADRVGERVGAVVVGRRLVADTG